MGLRSLFFALAVLCPRSHAAAAPPEHNVILIMLDGVRYEEFFGKPDPALSKGDTAAIFPSFWKSLAPTGTVYGKRHSAREMRVGDSHNLSLPNYEALFAGKAQGCYDNDCRRVGEETFAERLVREGKIPKEKVATIASWDHIPLAVEHTAGTIFVNAGFQAMQDGHPDPLLSDLNARQLAERPSWADARLDHFTYAQALRYLKVHRPRFLFISFDDSDEWAHLGRYAEYLHALRQYDTWLEEIHTTLSGMGDYGKNTCLIVTTDHGRGAGNNWKNHGLFTPHAEYVWLYTDCLGVNAPAPKGFSHLEIRPTIEKIFGLSPRQCRNCGQPLLPRKG